jgi:peptidyl-prolyl cis-trans isomerase B (cyclophilin B)
MRPSLKYLALAAIALPLFVAADKKTWDKPPEMKIDPNKSYSATIDTDKGAIHVDLFAKEAPKTVNNFVFLAKEGFYDGVAFHRVIPDFMIQGGDRNGEPAGTGDAGYKFEDETDPDKNPHKFDKPGMLAMANAGPNTNGSQFFITHVPTPWLNGHHTIFGQVKSDEDQKVVNSIEKGDKIKSVKIEEK